jgi:hypothetical protein
VYDAPVYAGSIVPEAVHLAYITRSVPVVDTTVHVGTLRNPKPTVQDKGDC